MQPLKRIAQLQLIKSQSQSAFSRKNNTSFVLTSHPTNLEFNYKDKNGALRRPSLWEETTHYYSLLAKNKIPQNTQTWIGFDMDRHQDEQDNILIYTFLQNLHSTLLREEKIIENNCISEKINEISKNLVKSFENPFKNQSYYSVQNDLVDLKELMEQNNIAPAALKGQYRISADDLQNDDGKKKIKNRLKELANIKSTFGVDAVSEIIIADCTKPEEINCVKSLIESSGLNLDVTPLIEDNLDDETLKDIIKNADKKVMLAGSDSIQRDTYIGALRMKLKIQKLLQQHNKENPYDQKIFFEGAGSTINRNGSIFASRMGTILENMPYARTIQGQEARQFITDNNNHQSRTITEAQSPRCTTEQLESALPLIEKLYAQISQQHKTLQNDENGDYTNKFNKDMVFDFVRQNSHYGSRAKQPQNSQNFKIKDQRAITQSMIHNKMHFQPEMMHWDTITDEIKNEIKSHLNNPIIQDMLNQYTALWQSCNLKEAKKWIKDEQLHNDFTESHKAFKDFIQEIKQLPNCPKNLLLNDIEDHRKRFNLQHLPKDDVQNLQSVFMKTTLLGSNPQVRTLLQNTGCGFAYNYRANSQLQHPLSNISITEPPLKTRQASMIKKDQDKIYKDLQDLLSY